METKYEMTVGLLERLRDRSTGTADFRRASDELHKCFAGRHWRDCVGMTGMG